jgi:hypothetical protein
MRSADLRRAAVASVTVAVAVLAGLANPAAASPRPAMRSGPASAAAQAHSCHRHAASQPPSAGSTSELDAVGATSSCNAWAVGYGETGAGISTVIDHWNGTSWIRVTSPDPGTGFREDFLNGVAVISARDIWAVGYVKKGPLDSTIVVHWNGARWKTVRSPDPGGTHGQSVLNAVSAVSARNIWSVGYYQHSHGKFRTLVERWNGSEWKVVPSPSLASTGETSLRGVAAAGSRAWAGGLTCTPACHQVILSWNGARWSKARTPHIAGATFSEINGMSAAGRVAWAVGDARGGSGSAGIIERWNGHHWSRQLISLPSGADSYLESVDALSAKSAAAVGYSSGSAVATLIETWSGHKWAELSGNFAPYGPSPDYILFGIGGTTCSNAWAVGTAEATPSDSGPIADAC